MHSMDPQAIMHLNATLTGRKLITQDEVWGLHRLYGTFAAAKCCSRPGFEGGARRLVTLTQQFDDALLKHHFKVTEDRRVVSLE